MAGIFWQSAKFHERSESLIDSSEITASLRTLGLEPGATPDDIHSAFRKLARELHPDVAGQQNSIRFQKVTGAYTLLKNLAPDELEELSRSIPEREKERIRRAEQKRREDAAKAERSAKIDSIITKYEADFREYTGRKQGDDSDMRALIFRMKSRKPKVINAALKHSAPFANRVEFRKALTDILKRPEIDSVTADIAASLPFDAATRKLIALDTSANAGNFPSALIISLIGNDPDSMESMLLHVSPENVALILRRWPAGKIMNDGIIRTLLASDDMRVLVPLLGAIRTSFPRSARNHSRRLHELENHPAAAVRAWARKLL